MLAEAGRVSSRVTSIAIIETWFKSAHPVWPRRANLHGWREYTPSSDLPFRGEMNMDFNPSKTSQAERTRKENYEGGEAFEPDSPERELYNLVSANFLEDTFYREDTEALSEIMRAVEAVAEENPEFILKLAQFARHEMYLREVPQLLLVLSAYVDGLADDETSLVKEYGQNIISRADEPVKVLAIWEYLRDNVNFADETSDTMPTGLKKAIGFAMKDFDAYQLAKYDTDRRQKNLKDVLNVAHPVPANDEQAELYQKLAYGDLTNGSAWRDHWQYGAETAAEEVDPLEPPETWEVVISERGNTQEAWEDVLPRMGLMARLRNLRNMLEAGVAEEDILNTPMKGKDYKTGEYFTIDEDGMTMDGVRNSYVLPFRYYTAYLMLERERGIRAAKIAEWLEDAVNVGAEDLPDLYGNSVVAVDVSGSMRHRLSRDSVVQYMDIAALFGGIFGRKGAETYGFATKYDQVNAHPSTPAIEYARKFYEWEWGEATHGNKFIRYLRQQEIARDRVVMLTDGQLYSETTYGRGPTDSFRDEWNAYKDEVAPEASLYVLDLSSYGDLLMPEGQPDVYQISGWDDNVLNFMEYGENPDAMIREIENVEP